MGSLGVVALFNANPDVLALVGKLLESAGFEVVSATITEVRDGRFNVHRMIDRHDPTVVVYDVAAPYDQNWAMFQQLRATAMKDRRFVVTSANPAWVERLAGRDEHIVEIVDQPLDLDNIVQAVKEAARARRFIPGNSHEKSNVTPMPERRFQSDRRQPQWTPNDIHQKLRAKREEMEFERRRFGRRATDRDHAA